MTTQRIRGAFETRLTTANLAPIAFENEAFVPPAGAYLRAFLLPAATVSRTLDRLHREYLGVFQVTVVLPPNQPIGVGQALIDQVAALFPVAAPMVQAGLEVWLEQPMSQGPAFQDGTRMTIALSAPYQAHTV